MTPIPSRVSGRLSATLTEWVLPLIVLGLVFAVTVGIVGPFGNFPLNDDWSFGSTTQRLFATGIWAPTSYPSMPLITNALWALPVCSVTACSFDDLRIATLLAAVLLFVATFVLIRSRGSVAVAIVAAATMIFNPIGYTLSFTFMTDVLFWALVTISAIVFIASLERDSVLLAVVGTLVSIAATLSRQLALAVPLAFGLVCLLQAGPWRRKSLVAVVPVLVCGAVLVGFDHWLVATGKVPAQLTAQSEGILQSFRMPGLLAKRVAENMATAYLYMGLFSLPVLLLTRRPDFEPPNVWLRRAPRLLACAAVVLTVAIMVAAHRIMPFGKNILVPEGVGPLTLRDAFVLGLPNVPRLPAAWWMAVTLLGLVGTYALVDRLSLFLVATALRFPRERLRPDDASPLFAVLAVLAYTTPLLALSAYDRYFVAFLPLAFFVIVATASPAPVMRFRFGAAAAILLALTVFSVLALHDYFAWNRTRWTAIADLQAAHEASPETLDGGIEYNGLFSYDPSYTPTPNKSFWWVKNDDYMITFGPVAGMTVLKQYPYRAYLPPFERSIFVLHH
ncbi:hypothetical protein [Lichenifustis flavocetrariae]|uniref:Glycosyltransferase RgtA/B/C/D-like domain-containing protein n=1 Tax=Lichenifustis flavocetrariae TaxID=2949735 RepID=A0AA42CJX4_9HYPH|nr:hypothetical protein [Lichenifustis flavocetrariae]MCW6508566.1 hypothetical protein [Lichenifustis flavocetrariae]